MYHRQEYMPQTKRGILYFIVYSIILFIITATNFWDAKTLIYFLVGFALSGIIAVLFMSIQYKVEEKLNPNFWVLNILIEVIGYYLFTRTLFSLFF